MAPGQVRMGGTLLRPCQCERARAHRREHVDEKAKKPLRTEQTQAHAQLKAHVAKVGTAAPAATVGAEAVQHQRVHVRAWIQKRVHEFDAETGLRATSQRGKASQCEEW